jgi:predicted O-methyltransferase YrrM
MADQKDTNSALKYLLDMANSAMYTKILFAGIELDVFSVLEEEKNNVEVAEKLNLNEENTKYLLDALTSLNLLVKIGGKYINSNISSEFLVNSSECYIGSLLKSKRDLDIDVVKLVKEGYRGEAENKNEKATRILSDYDQVMKTAQKVIRAKEIASIVTSLPEFCGFKKMLDLGGGPGLITIEIAKKHPELKCVIFDKPSTAKIAYESIIEFGMESRIEVLSGDYLADSIGEKYDFILASGTLNFAKKDLDTVVKKIYDALNPNGVFMCISDGLTEEGTKPKEMVINWLPYRLKGLDFGLEQGEVSNVALRCGFTNVYKRTVSMIVSEQDVDIAKKAVTNDAF